MPAARGDFLLARRERLVVRHLPLRAGTLLDLGCGNGAQTFSFVDRVARVLGVDIDAAHLRTFRVQASARRLGDRMQAVLYDGGDLPVAADSVDCAVCFTVLEHVRDEARTLGELRRVIKPDGVLIISVPNRWWIFETHGADLPLLPWNRVPFVSWWPRRLHDRFARARIYEKSDIERKIDAAGFAITASCHLTAPLDVLRWRSLRNVLRRSVFKADATRIPFLATEVLVVARKS